MMRIFLLALSLAFVASAIADPILDAAERHARAEAKGLPGEIGVKAGPLDPHTQLPSCGKLQTYTPAGAKPWGNTHVGVRCEEPVRWNIMVPVQISVTRQYLVTARPLAAGQNIRAEDLATLRGDLSLLPAGILTDASFALGKTLKNSVAAGQPLRVEQLMVPQLIKAGQSVRLIMRGSGFSVTGEGKALHGGGAGQILQVRVGTGQTISGVVQDDGSVEIRP